MESLEEDFLPFFRTNEVKSDVKVEAWLKGEPLPEPEPKQKKTRKVVRKVMRKVSKMTKLVQTKTGVKISQEDPCKWLVVWGVGVAYGNTKASIHSFFSPTKVEVRMFLEESYVFVGCEDADVADRLRDKYHDAKFNKSQTMYIAFVSKQFESAVPCEDSKTMEQFDGDLPEGLSIYTEFISEEEEAVLRKNLFVGKSTGTQLKKRTVQHFGYEFRYGTNDVDPKHPLRKQIPDYVQDLVVKKLMKSETLEREPDQLTVNQYVPGQGIPPHCDTHSCFEGPIVSLSIGSDIVMDFRSKDRIFSMVLPPRSLLVLRGPSRYGWTHGITPRKHDIIPDYSHGGCTVLPRKLRISLTFRMLSRGPRICDCDFPSLCDTQKGKITSENASSLEDELVHKVYENIAGHFTETRHKPWPKVKEFVVGLAPAHKLLDVGCANGKYFGLNPDIQEVGIDMSFGLLEKCREKGHQAIRANALHLPFLDDYFEGVISIAVLHHLATKERRIQFLDEIMRVLAPGGVALIYVWSKEQKLEDKPSTWSERQTERATYSSPDAGAGNPTADYSFLPVHDRGEEFPENDMLVPWVNKQEKQSEVHHRYYHVFDKGELEELLMLVNPTPLIVDQFYEQGNWVVKFKKADSL